jgi:trigger factor
MSNVESIGALERRLNASIPQQQLNGEIEARLKHLGRTAKVHGFRPGKVPLNILRQQYGAQVQQDVMGDALQRSFDEAVMQHSLRVASRPDFEIKSTDSATEQIEFSATFEIYPEVVLGNIEAEPVERVTCSMTEADVERTIETLLKQHVTYAVVDRAAQNADQVTIDFNGTLDGEPFEGGQAKDSKVILGAGRMLPDFEGGIINMEAGETKSFDVNFPEGYHGKLVEGKGTVFTVTLHLVESPHLPALNAEFAKKMGIVDGDVEKLRAEIRKNIGLEMERRLKLRNKDNAMDVLFNVVQMDVPKSMVEAEAQQLMQQTLEEMKQRGTSKQGMTLPLHLFTERAQRRVKLGLILVDLIQRHNLGATPEQTRALLLDYAQSFDHPEDVVKWHYNNPERLREVKNVVQEDNVVNWVMSTAKVVDRVVEFHKLMGNVNA